MNEPQQHREDDATMMVRTTTVEQMREEITSRENPKKQTQSLVALAALALRVKLDERFVAVVGAILDALDGAMTTTLTTTTRVVKVVSDDDDDDIDDDVNDVNAKNKNDDDDDKEGVAAAALAALSCVVGTVDGATKEMLKENNRGIGIVLKAIDAAMKEKKRTRVVNGLDCLAWTCREKECARVVATNTEDGKRVVEEARRMCDVEYVKEKFFSQTTTTKNTCTKNTKRSHESDDGKEEEEEEMRVRYRRQEDAVRPKQIVAGAFELFVALSVSEAEKMTTEYESLDVFSSAIKRVGGGDKANAPLAKDEEDALLERFKIEGRANPTEELERVKQHEIHEVASRALIGISCCCKCPGTAAKLCSDELLVRKIAQFMTSSDPSVKHQASALFAAIARAPECKPLVEKALRGARDLASA